MDFPLYTHPQICEDALRLWKHKSFASNADRKWVMKDISLFACCVNPELWFLSSLFTTRQSPETARRALPFVPLLSHWPELHCPRVQLHHLHFCLNFCHGNEGRGVGFWVDIETKDKEWSVLPSTWKIWRLADSRRVAVCLCLDFPLSCKVGINASVAWLPD